jgi:septum formation protein
MRLILASRSPRRLDILRRMGLDPRVDPARVDEEAIPASGHPRAYVLKLAALKAAEVAERLARERSAPEAGGSSTPNGSSLTLVLAADTTVALGGEFLNKPADADAARAMLRRLSGRAHEVLTGVCLSRMGSGEQTGPGESWLDAARTTVIFRTLDDDLIERYVASGSPLDKAGAYGVQDHGAQFPLIERVEGDYWNVVGLPAETVLRGLAYFGAAEGLTVPRPPELR